MQGKAQQVNGFLVDVFNDILRLEEANVRTGSCRNLSVSELHVLAAVHAAGEGGLPMAQIAHSLGVTASTLTTSVKTLENKGYVRRVKDEADKRRTLVRVTPAAMPALAQHDAFHQRLVEGVCSSLSPAQQDALCMALDKLHTFFGQLENA